MAPVAQRIEELEAENKRLALRVKALEKELYGSRSDRRPAPDPRQGTFSEIDEARAPEPVTAAPKRAGASKAKGLPRGPKPLNPDLPRHQEFIPDPDINALICPASGRPMKPGFTESVEVLARKPAEYYVRVLIRRVFVSPLGEAPVYSPWPSDVMPRSRIDVSVVASILSSRFADHQPYHRQSKQLERHGVSLPVNTQCSLVALACEKLQPVYQAVITDTLNHTYLMMDPTPVRLKSEHKSGSTKQATIWTYRALDGPVFFEFAENKKGSTPAQTLNTYQGILQTDGASNFGGLPAREAVTHLGCWAHVRRYFVKAEESGDTRATPYLETIDRLFRRERLIKRFGLNAEQTRELRRRYSLPAVDALYAKALDFAQNQTLLKTPLVKAINYTLARTQTLRECFLHAPSRIDNNLAENALRPIKLGAKNWLFIGHENAGPRTAIMFTLVENCRILGLNPEEYLANILARVDEHPNKRIQELTPHGWANAKAAQAATPL